MQYFSNLFTFLKRKRIIGKTFKNYKLYFSMIKGTLSLTVKNGVWKNRVFPVKNRFFWSKTCFFGKTFAKMLKNVKKGLLYAENSEKSLFFGKFHPSTFLGPLEGGGYPPRSFFIYRFTFGFTFHWKAERFAPTTFCDNLSLKR